MTLAPFPLLLFQLYCLGVATWSDVRNPRDISFPIAVAPLVFGLAFGLAFGKPLPSLATAIAASCVFILEFSTRWLMVLVVVVGILVIYFLGSPFLAVSFGILSILSFFNVLGTADALAVMGCLILSPSFEMAMSIMVGLFIAVLVATLLAQRGRFFFALADAFRRTVTGRMPSEEELHRMGQPTLWGVFIGFLWFLICFQIPVGAGG